MLKHIVGQAIFQIIVLILLMFFGQHFIPEYADDFDNQIGQDLSAKYYMGQA
jgi:Ca2+ transporting ATPase